MRPSEVRERVLADHEQLRLLLEEVEKAASRVIEGETTHVGDLRAAGETLLARLLAHMSWEDLYLAPALRDADAWGEQRAALLAEDHRDQRSWLHRTLAELQDQQRPGIVLARQLVDLVQRLREDMASEERDSLDPRVLRDDVIAIDADSG